MQRIFMKRKQSREQRTAATCLTVTGARPAALPSRPLPRRSSSTVSALIISAGALPIIAAQAADGDDHWSGGVDLVQTSCEADRRRKKTTEEEADTGLQYRSNGKVWQPVTIGK